MDKPRIANLGTLKESMQRSKGDRYEMRLFPIGPSVGARKLGFNVTELPPGKAAFPYHFHHVNEELFLVLEGEGTLRSPGGSQPIKVGDIVCCPPGADGAHQIVNSGSVVLRYLALSTMEDPEVVEYPDSGKYGVVVGRPPGGRPADAKFHAFAFKKDAVDYWAGEE
jgi:uncharacterized cupin superfamily protein